VDDLGELRVLARERRVVVAAGGLDEPLGQVPLLEEPGADVGVGGAQDLRLRLGDQAVARVDDVEDLDELLGMYWSMTILPTSWSRPAMKSSSSIG
jgi:hypothetical protein